MLRAATLARYGVALALAPLLACGAAPPPPLQTPTRADALPVSDNQQGHRAADEAETTTDDTEALPPEQPSIPGVYLWCQLPTGRACRMASAALGTGPKAISGLPPGLLNVEDRGNDCEEPTIASIGARLATAFAVQPSGWRDQGGSYLDMSTIGDMYQAAGCINDADPSRPIAKISAADGSTPRLYLVRVWDGQPVTPTY